MKIGFDIIFLAIIGLGAVGGFFLGDEKAQRMVIGSLVGSFAATLFAEPLSKLLEGKASFVNQTVIAIALVAVCVLLCVLGKNVRDKKWPRSRVKAIISGALSSAVAIAFVIASLTNSTRENLVTEHNLAALAYDLRLYLAGALVVWLFATYLTVGKAKR